MCTQIQSHAGSEEEERKSKIKSKKKRDKEYRHHKFLLTVHKCGTHRGAKVVAYFVCKSDMGDFRRYVGGVVLYSDYTSVERLLFSV